MNIFVKTTVVIVGCVALFACKKTEPKTAQELLQGKWMVTNSNIMGSDIPGDGSYMQFNACGTTCGGVDFKASDTTSGNFTYSIDADATVISITDTTSNGGSWNGSWDVLTLTENSLKITGSTFLGNLTVTFQK